MRASEFKSLDYFVLYIKINTEYLQSCLLDITHWERVGDLQGSRVHGILLSSMKGHGSGKCLAGPWELQRVSRCGVYAVCSWGSAPSLGC